MDRQTVKELEEIISDYYNGYIPEKEANKRLKQIFHDVSKGEIITELSIYVNSIIQRDKNIHALIVILSLTMLYSEDIDEIKKLILRKKLDGPLFGGLIVLFSGESSILRTELELSCSSYHNKYEYIKGLSSTFYWDFYNIFQLINLLADIDSNRFEKLALKDKTNLILLNVMSENLDVEYSDKLIESLLNNSDELKQNIGLALLTSNIQEYKNMDNIPSNKVREEIAKCLVSLSSCNDNTKVALLTNYVLYHKDTSPNEFIEELLNDEHAEEFYNQIVNDKKANKLEDVKFLASIIYKNPTDKLKIRAAAVNMGLNAICKIVIRFVKEKRSIYFWNYENYKPLEYILIDMPTKYKLTIIKELSEIDRDLMYTELDRMVRYKLYLIDKPQHDIIVDILDIIDTNYELCKLKMKK